MKSTLPIIALISVALIFVLGIVAFQAAMMEVNAETNFTRVNATLVPYEIEYGWFGGMALLALIIALGFVFWHFWR